MTVVIDSDILIEITRGRDAAILSRWMELCDSDDLILCSPVSVAELWHGARPNEHAVLTNFFSAIVCVPIEQEDGRRAGAYLSRYRGSHGVELADALIAAAATGHRAALWTRNRKHYPMKDLIFF